MTGAVLGAFLIAGIYYLGYLDLFTSQYDRAIEGGGVDSGIAGLVGEQIGYIYLATAALGCLSFLRNRLALCWLLTTLFFLALDLKTALEIRYWLQALPLLALFSGAYLSRALDRSALGKGAAAGAFVYIAFVGLRTMFECMVYRYH